MLRRDAGGVRKQGGDEEARWEMEEYIHGVVVLKGGGGRRGRG